MLLECSIIWKANSVESTMEILMAGRRGVDLVHEAVDFLEDFLEDSVVKNGSGAVRICCEIQVYFLIRKVRIRGAATGLFPD